MGKMLSLIPINTDIEKIETIEGEDEEVVPENDEEIEEENEI